MRRALYHRTTRPPSAERTINERSVTCGLSNGTDDARWHGTQEAADGRCVGKAPGVGWRLAGQYPLEVHLQGTQQWIRFRSPLHWQSRYWFRRPRSETPNSHLGYVSITGSNATIALDVFMISLPQHIREQRGLQEILHALIC